MGQITESFARTMLEQCARKEHPSLTVWEAEQLARAWLRLAEAMFILEVCVPILIDSCKQHDKGAIQRWDEARGTRWPRADDSAPLDMVPAPDGSRVLCVADSEESAHD